MQRFQAVLIDSRIKILVLFLILLSTFPAYSQEEAIQKRMEALYVSTDPADHPERDFERDISNKAKTDSAIFSQCEGLVDAQKIRIQSRIGDMDIPVYIFQPLEKRGHMGHAALVWVHGGVHNNLTEMYFRFIPEAVKRGYVVIAPEYRGSTGYGPDHYFAIDYGGYEIDDCLTAVDYMIENMPHVDPERIGIWGLSHGGFIALHSVFRQDNPFKCGVALVPVSNLIFRLSYKGPRYQRYFATQKRIQGLPFEKRDIYIERSPVYHVDKLKVPLLVHVATNDEDVNFVECEMLIHALEVKKPELAETKTYVDPPNGHTFTLRGDSPQLKDSWIRQWAFLEWNLRPDLDKSKSN